MNLFILCFIKINFDYLKMSGDTIGMMEGAFFVSKSVILDWINELLDVSTLTIFIK